MVVQNRYEFNFFIFGFLQNILDLLELVFVVRQDLAMIVKSILENRFQVWVFWSLAPGDFVSCFLIGGYHVPEEALSSDLLIKPVRPRKYRKRLHLLKSVCHVSFDEIEHWFE